MERAPLRPVPQRPSGPVDPEQAVRHVSAALPALDEAAARALGLVALAGRRRPETAAAAGLGADELGEALTRARKTLRRSIFPLPGSGWCERAERLVSDRLDDALEPPGPARLEAHLRNCPRCVEHERRLVQATDALVSDFAAAHPAPAPASEPAPAAAPPLTVVAHDATAGPTVLPFGAPVRPAPARPRARPAAAAASAPPAPVPVPVPAPEPPAVTAPPPALERPARPLSALAWNVLLVIAVILAVATVAIAVAGALGASL